MRFEKKSSLKQIFTSHTFKNNINRDAYDELQYNKLYKKSGDLQKIEKSLKDKFKSLDELNKDVYAGLYKYNPELIEQHFIKAEYLPNRIILEELMKNRKFEELRNYTKLDPTLSFLGTVNVQDKIKELIDQNEELQQALKQVSAAAQQQQGPGQGQANGISDENGQPGRGEDQQALTKEEAKKILEEKLKNLKNEVQKTLNKNAVNNILQESLEQIVEVSDLISHWGLENSPEYMYSGHDKKLEILERLQKNKKLKRISDFLGKLKALKIKEGRDKVKKGFDEISDIITSNNLSKILSMEYLNLFDPDLELVFLEKYQNQKLLTLHVKTKYESNLGPIIIAIDNSGSMSGAPEIWSKGVAMAILETARKQKRDVYILQFSSESKSNIKVHDFTVPNHHNINEIIEFANYFSNGGTLFHPALELAKDIIDTNKKFDKADILFITDGESAVPDSFLKKFNKWKVQRNVKVVTVLINVYYGSSATIDEFSNKVHKLSDLHDSLKGENLSKALEILDGI